MSARLIPLHRHGLAVEGHPQRFPHLSVVEMMTRLVNGFFPDAVKNESISALASVGSVRQNLHWIAV